MLEMNSEKEVSNVSSVSVLQLPALVYRLCAKHLSSLSPGLPLIAFN